jgi:hypothetical protein
MKKENIANLFETIEQQQYIINSLEKELIYRNYKNRKLQEKINILSSDIECYKKIVKNSITFDEFLNNI